VTIVFNSTIAFPVMQMVKTNHKPCFDPLFSPMFILNTFLRHRLWAEFLVGIFPGHFVLWCWWY